MLHNKQKLALELFKSGYNIFITGSAGTGKSFIINEMKKIDKDTVITSTTGISALNVNGITIHSWAGITIDTDFDKPDAFSSKIQNNYLKLNNYLYTKRLIIDEISMLSIDILEFINKVCQIIRCSNEAFGGIQVIFIGDFFQLPPVNEDTFAFKSSMWDKIIDYTVVLTKCFRQNDNQLIHFLNKIRIGKLNDEIVTFMKNCSLIKPDTQYTHLYSNKINVEVKNLIELEKIKSEKIVSKAVIINKKKNKVQYSFPEKTNIIDELTLKKGCFIMINTNLDINKKLVNGTQGIFNGIYNGKANITANNGRIYNISKFKWEFKDFYVEQYPFCLAWAITIHKSQGMGIEHLSIDIGSSIFEDGQAYVAISRTKTIEGLHIKNFNVSSIKSNKKVKKFYSKLKKKEKEWVTDDNVFKNVLNGRIKSTLPKNGILVDLNEKETSFPPSKNKFINFFKPCRVCDQGFSRNDYVQWYGEEICTSCIIEDDDYKQMSKKEIYKLYEYRFRKNFIDTILKKMKYKPNIASNKFRTRSKIYINKHFKEAIQS